jgi:diacylglycerol kinase
VNRISFEHNELSGLAKDLGSSALFFAGGQALMIWSVFLASRLLNY